MKLTIASLSRKPFVLFRHRSLGGFAKAIEVPVGSLAGRNFLIKENRPTESGVRGGIGLNLEWFKSSGLTLRSIPSSLLESLRLTPWGFSSLLRYACGPIAFLSKGNLRVRKWCARRDWIEPGTVQVLRTNASRHPIFAS